ncbi:DNA adenine methylase [Pseudovibrio exalbescens]|uniref:DNA adenine methylase n=1 Tax=Pseudovibrio exalbescens TaxID=197461 RepID=UPI0023665485|nr:DNA adenine methylase [Pseudovibrio exalbescens]MDD7908668.1 DNA adenine methylase [Pseudovibrio exalbescens]
MSKSSSPLRYPGGKSCLLPLVSNLLKINSLRHRSYAEPYAGGCGLALSLLYASFVSEIHVNDIDASIWSFWYSVLSETEELCERINTAEMSIDEWRRQKEVYSSQDVSDPVSLGFATFYLNRTNRSGIIKDAGVIGGLNQTGNYKMDCRFNKDDLERRIRRVAKYKRRIHLYRLDALEFIKESQKITPEKTFFCIDPPYYKKGSSLYTSFYKPDDHALLAKTVLDLEKPWIVTYDNTPEIQELYNHMRQYSFDVNYSVQTKRVGNELLIASENLNVPSELERRKVA